MSQSFIFINNIIFYLNCKLFCELTRINKNGMGLKVHIIAYVRTQVKNEMMMSVNVLFVNRYKSLKNQFSKCAI